MIEFAKGHGTGNDFVVIADVDNAAPLPAARIAALCDRRFGIGADGLLRVVRAAKHPDGVAHADAAEWFMDYYNADGSIAEMCGNGVRVFAAYLRQKELAAGDVIPVATRAGLRTVTIDTDDYRVDMGPVRIAGASSARLGDAEFPGTMAFLGNPHLVCPAVEPNVLDLSRRPEVPAGDFPDGVNVEFYTRTAEGIRMRVHERGVGETLSCGTGACAAAAVDLAGPGSRIVDVPGGRLRIRVDENGTVTMAGPAVLVAEGVAAL